MGEIGGWLNLQICHIPNAEKATKCLLSNDKDAYSITKYGFLVPLGA